MGRLSFLMACLLSTLYVLAQGPGGVSGAELWHIATAATNNTDTNYVWRDYSGDGARFVSTTNDQLIMRPQSEMQSFNFHPSLHFDSISGKVFLKHANLAQATLIGVFAPDTMQLFQGIANPIELYRTTGRPNEKIFMLSNIVIDDTLGPLSHKYLEDNYALFEELALRTITYERANLPNHSVWGVSDTSSLSFNPIDRSFTGYSPEMIVYGRMLSQLERRKVETYLAMKYGITLWGSYISPDNQLIWDNNDLTFHHRVTAIGKYSKGSLEQPLSTTSYEESPRLSIIPENDSFYKRGIFNKPSAQRLLTLGHEYGYSLPDNTFMIWGDNGDTLSIDVEFEGDSPWHVMKRMWMLNSNMPSGIADSTIFNATNINVTKYKDGLYSLHRSEPSASESSVTFGSRTTNDLHFSFVCPENYPAFVISVKSGSGNRPISGYKFETNGYVYKIINDRVLSSSFYNNVKGHLIDFYKKDGRIYLQIDGEGLLGSVITLSNRLINSTTLDSLINIDPLDSFDPYEEGEGLNAVDHIDGLDQMIPVIPIDPSEPIKPIEIIREVPYEGFIGVVSGTTPFNIYPFRVDGFSNTGNQLELSYNIAETLKPYRKNRSILLINESPEFDDPNEVDQRIACTNFDVNRQKLMFHNIFFKKDSISYFTFGAFDGLLADFTPIRAICGPHGATESGKLKIDINCGSPLYKCTMIPRLYPQNLQTYIDSLTQINQAIPEYLTGITFGSSHYTVRYLRPGEYSLTLEQLGGDNIYACESPNTDRYYRSNVSNTDSSNVRWLITDTLSDYKAGLLPTSGSDIYVGFRVVGKKCYYLSGTHEVLINDNVSPGDSLKIRSNSSNVFLTCNETTDSLPINTNLPVFKVEFSRGEATLAHVIFGDMDSIPDGEVTDESILVEHVIPFAIHKTVFIGSECDEDLPNEVTDPVSNAPQQAPPRRNYADSGIDDLVEDNGSLRIKSQGGQDFTAELTTSDSGIAQLLVFDTMGRLVAEGTMSNSAVKTVSFSVPAFGVYIVKVLTDHEEYSEKILCK